DELAGTDLFATTIIMVSGYNRSSPHPLGHPSGWGADPAATPFELAVPDLLLGLYRCEPFPRCGCPFGKACRGRAGWGRIMASYLVLGDLHGRVLPAFALAQAWQRDHTEPLAGLLQVGDLGYFPFHDRLDKATKRHAQRDAMEL